MYFAFFFKHLHFPAQRGDAENEAKAAVARALAVAAVADMIAKEGCYDGYILTKGLSLSG